MTNKNPTLNLIEKRRSIRTYSPHNITQEEKDLIIQATFRAPTAGNMMLYSIIEIEDQTLKNRLAVTCDNQPFIAKAPWVLLFLADYQRWFDYFVYCECERRCKELNQIYRKPEEGDLLLACCDALIAAQTAVIAAESLGIGSCYLGDILENYETHREILSLPPYVIPITLICFGHPAKEDANIKQSSRFGRDFIIHKNAYKRLKSEDMEKMIQPFKERNFKDGKFPEGAENIGQTFYLRKFIADFSVEMRRSVREMLKNWY